MAQPRAVGIDLGTTYSAVAYLDDRGRSAMVRNAAGEVLTPSVVLFEETEVIVGKEAKKFAALRPDCVAECAKRDMGEPHYSRPIRGRNMPAQVIQACILRQLNEETKAKLGPGFKTVITVPAYFDEARRRATAQAGEMAGIDVLDIVNEPTAAALSFGESLGYLTPTGDAVEPMKVLVYDLGGGTFDVTVIELAPGKVRTLATDGDVRLGGRDWDEALLQYLADQFTEKHGADPRHDPAALSALLVAVEEAKRTLSTRSKATIPIRTAGKSGDVSITVAQFEDLTEPLLERTSLTTRHVLAAAGLKWNQIDRLLLVGGATRMPMVVRMLERLSGKRPDRSVHPDEAVARGAAIFAGYLLSKGEHFKAVMSDDDLHIAADEMWDKRQRGQTGNGGGQKVAAVSGPASGAKVMKSTADEDGIEFEPVDFEDADQPKCEPARIASTSSIAAASAQPKRDERKLAPEKPQSLTPLPPAATTPARTPVVPDTSTAGPTFTVTDVNAHSLGIEGIDPRTYRRENVILIPRNTPLPARVRHKFVTKEEGQRTVVVQVLEGENSDPQQCSRIGRAVMRKLPVDLPRGWPIYVIYQYGTNGRLSVHASVPGTDRNVAIQLEHERGLSDEGVRKWRKVLDEKKGFDAFESMLDEVLDEAEAEEETSRSAPLNVDDELPPVADVATNSELAPATSTAPSRMRRDTRGWIIAVTGFLISAVLGLTFGYYLLALYTPKGNFLNLPLPGLPIDKAENDETESE
jgi:molecular chaperone DnaK